MDKINKIAIISVVVAVCGILAFLFLSSFGKPILSKLRFSTWLLIIVVVAFLIFRQFFYIDVSTNKEVKVKESVDSGSELGVVSEEISEEEVEEETKSECPECGGSNTVEVEGYDYIFGDEVKTFVCGDCNIKYVEQV